MKITTTKIINIFFRKNKKLNYFKFQNNHRIEIIFKMIKLYDS